MENGQEKEMDLLLRALGRRAAALPSQSDTGEGENPLSAHLDADALIAFAENALPMKARSRYLEHLADCERCRSILVGLSANSEVLHEKSEITLIAHSPTLVERIVAMFRMPSLRYGLPVAAVLVLVTTVLFTTMKVTRHSLVAVNDRTSEPLTKSVEEVPSPATAAQDHVEAIGNANRTEQPQQSRAGKIEPMPSGSVTIEEQKAAPIIEDRTKSAAASKDIDALAEVDDKKTKEPDDNSVAKSSKELNTEARSAAQGPPPPAAAAEPRRDEKLDDSQPADQPARESEKAPTNKPDLAKSGSGFEYGGRVRRKESRGSDNERNPGLVAGAAASTPSSDAIRTVGGKRFRKGDDGWVDSSFNSSASAINVRRGSEQYRALIADEPELKVFAEQLAGPVIVVWKGQAYRFH